MTSADDVRFSELSRALGAAVDQAIEQWVIDAVASRVETDITSDLPGDLAERARETAREAKAVVGAELEALLASDIDRQRTNPLAVLRGAVKYPTRVLLEAGVQPPSRDADAERLHPDDLYDLTPAAFSDFGPEVHDAGLQWGAAKAHVHLQRRRSEGQR